MLFLIGKGDFKEYVAKINIEADIRGCDVTNHEHLYIAASTF